MTTNKPEVVAWSWDYRGRHMATTDYSQALELAEPPYPTKVDPLIRLADYQRLQADHERLQSECAKLRKDAERYRWLRLGAHDDSDLDRWEHVGYVCGVSVCTDYGVQQTLDAEALDAAIDAAMQGDRP